MYNKSMTVKEFKANKKVVIGFTGRMDSVVAAYLLSKQGYEVIAVSVIFYPREDEGLAPVFTEDGEELQNDEFFCVNKVDDLDQIKSITKKMGITFYAVDASAEYKNLVSDKVIAARVAGTAFSPEYEAHSLLLSILSSKADLLEASFIATGHFAKLSLAHSNKPINILSSSDLANNQCDYLAKANHKIYSKLKLPLADMRKTEVVKIASTLGFDILSEKKPWRDIINYDNFSTFVRKRLPLSIIKTGQVIDYINDTYLFDHQGIHNFYVGQTKIKSGNNISIDPELMVADIHYSSGTIVVIKPEFLTCERVIIKSLRYEKDEDISSPSYVFLKRDGFVERYRGLISIKNNGFAEFIFDTPTKMIFCRGETISLFSHSGEGARIYGIGEVMISGTMRDGQVKKFPQKEEDIIEGEEVEKKESDFRY